MPNAQGESSIAGRTQSVSLERMGFRFGTLAVVVGAVALAVGCNQDASKDAGADEGGSSGSSGSSFAGVRNGSGGLGSSSAGARDDGGASGSSFAGANDGGASGSSFAGAPGDGTVPSRLSCLGVLQCAGACPDETVDACVQTCLDQTSESSKPVTTAFVQCIADKECADSACIQANCQSQLSDCVADDASVAAQGEPPSSANPTGSIPSALVGLWSQVGLSSGMSYEFSADGTTIQAYSNETSYGCTLKTQLSSSGVTTVTGDSLVYHRLEGSVGMTTCGTVQVKPLVAADIAYRYSLGTFDDGVVKLSLFLVNEDGTLSSPIELHR